MLSQKTNETMNTAQPPSHTVLRINAKMMDVRFKHSLKRGLSPGLLVIPEAPSLLNSAVEGSGTDWCHQAKSLSSKRG